MKKSLLLSAVALLTFTCFSCSADSNDSADKTIKAKKEITPQTPKYASGPDDKGNTPPPPTE